jgi:sugar phosphate isomerase/epimerase
MWTLSGFADEISANLDEQCDLLDTLRMHNLEFRSVDGINVADLTDQQLAAVKQTLDRRGIGVTCIGSPIGKTDITADFGEQLPRFERSIRAAQVLGSPFVRVFSFYTQDPVVHRDEVLRRMSRLAADAEKAGVTLLHENETKVYGETPERCVDLFEGVGSPALRATWDPANFVHAGFAPFTEAYPVLRPYLVHLQIKDCTDAGNVPAGQGAGQIPETLAALRDSGFDGVFSLEPHLSAREGMIGFSGPELFTTAATAFTGLLHDAKAEWQ